MRKFIQFIVVVFLIICTLSYNSFAQTCRADLEMKLLASTVQLYIDTDLGTAICTGIIVAKNSYSTGILTAKHCTQNAEEIYIDGFNMSTTIHYELEKYDLSYVVLFQSYLYRDAISIFKGKVLFNEGVCNLGYPRKARYSAGKVIAVMKNNLYTDNSSIPGCSGSGIINKNGQLIGILWGGYSKDKNSESVITVSSNNQAIINFLRQINKLKEVYLEN